MKIRGFWDDRSVDEQVFIVACLSVIVLIVYIFLHGVGDVPLNLLILDLSENFFVCFIGLCIIFFDRLIFKRVIKGKVFYVAWLLFFVLSIPHIPVLYGYETTQIGDFYEAREYKEKYFVVMSRKPEDIEDRKQYTLPAEIERRLTYEGSDDNGNDFYSLNYHINYLYFPNGGYLSFDYDYAYEEAGRTSVKVNKETEVVDYHGDEYYITLTKEKAK